MSDRNAQQAASATSRKGGQTEVHVTYKTYRRHGRQFFSITVNGLRQVWRLGELGPPPKTPGAIFDGSSLHTVIERVR